MARPWFYLHRQFGREQHIHEKRPVDAVPTAKPQQSLILRSNLNTVPLSIDFRACSTQISLQT
ncbi:hypothetical protein VCR29J2_430055 [Vibrio coralliirubri]|nr:hypothetical protein VCR29J2_430055 [Vibrio coralliirubri]